MASTLITSYPAFGTLQIGNWTPNNFTETNVDIKPVMSLDGRSVAYSEITINIHARFVGDVGVANLQLAYAIPSMQKSGVGITYRGRGLDRLFRGLGARDIAWGPMPGSLKIKPLGGIPANAFDVHFTITAKVPTCPTARFTGPIDLATSITFEIDYAGYLTRTYAGRLRIANNLRADGRGGTDSPDAYREDVTPTPLPGFYRLFGPWVTSEDRTELSFSIRDEELPGLNIPPAWVVGKPVLSHKVASTSISGKPSLKSWVAHFSGHYELAKDAPDSNWPALHFFDVFVAGRIDALLKGFGSRRGTGTKGAVVPLAVDFGEPNVLDRRVFDFSCAFSYVDDIGTVIGNSGMWTPLSGNNWREWSTSLSSSAFNPYGTSRAAFTVADDQTITGLCSAPPSVSAGATDRVLRSAGSGFEPEDWIDRTLRSVKPETSWLEYENNLSLLPRTGTVELRTLPTKPSPQAGRSDLTTSPPPPNTGKWAEFDRILGEKFDAVQGGRNILPGGADPGVINPGSQNPIGGDRGGATSIQRRVPDSFKIVMEGYALRAGYPIPAPTLTRAGGANVVPIYEKDMDYWKHSLVSNAGGVGIYCAAWRFTYKVDGPIVGAIGPAPNPLLQPAA